MDLQEQRSLQYRIDVINTASPEHLVLMLYNAAMTEIGRFRDALQDPQCNALGASQQARDILSGLADNVNMSHPHGQTMRDLYLYCWRTLLTASLSRSSDELDAVETVLRNLIEGLSHYREADRTVDAATNEPYVSINFAG